MLLHGSRPLRPEATMLTLKPLVLVYVLVFHVPPQNVFPLCLEEAQAALEPRTFLCRYVFNIVPLQTSLVQRLVLALVTFKPLHIFLVFLLVRHQGIFEFKFKRTPIASEPFRIPFRFVPRFSVLLQVTLPLGLVVANFALEHHHVLVPFLVHRQSQFEFRSVRTTIALEPLHIRFWSVRLSVFHQTALPRGLETANLALKPLLLDGVPVKRVTSETTFVSGLERAYFARKNFRRVLR